MGYERGHGGYHHCECGHSHHGHAHHHHHDHYDRDDGAFDEKRVIDTIVDLVGERVERLLDDRQARAHGHDGGGDEKRIIDLIVRLVSEHVREIVAEELDRRLGRTDAPPLARKDEPG